MRVCVNIALQGAKLAGGNPAKNRVENDFYATNPKAVEKLLLEHYFKGNTMLEPCVGQGHIAKTVYAFYNNNPKITALDIVDRGYPNTITQDFLTWETDKKFEMIISNPPYSLGKEFIEKGMELLTEKGQMAMFLKIQFLEGAKRKELFENIHQSIFMCLEIEWQLLTTVNLSTLMVRSGLLQCATLGLFGRKVVQANLL